MPQITKCQYAEWDRAGSINWKRNGNYTNIWDVHVDKDDLFAGQVIEMAWDLDGSPHDRVQEIGETFEFGNNRDVSAICLNVSAKLYDPKIPTRWQVTAQYGQPPKGYLIEHLLEPNPISWPPSYGLRVVEETIPLEKATCVTNLGHINRGPMSLKVPGDPGEGTNEPGLIVNSVGQQTVDPLTRVRRRPIVIAKRNYSNLQAIINLNDEYEDTTNSLEFLGTPARTWRYLWTDAGDLVQTKVNGQSVSYYPGVTALELNKDTWDVFIVNNGMVCLRTIPDSDPVSYVAEGPGAFNFKLFDCQVTARDSEGNDVLVPTAEPVMLNLDGTQAAGGVTGQRVQYRHLEEKDYNLMGAGLWPSP